MRDYYTTAEEYILYHERKAGIKRPEKGDTMSNQAEIEKGLAKIGKLEREIIALKKIARVAAWTHHGSRIYKGAPFIEVSREFYSKLMAAYADYEKEYDNV